GVRIVQDPIRTLGKSEPITIAIVAIGVLKFETIRPFYKASRSLPANADAALSNIIGRAQGRTEATEGIDARDGSERARGPCGRMIQNAFASCADDHHRQF